MPSLCHHKSPAHCAALCVFDLRAGLHMVQRFSLPHRSLYPRLRLARGHYVFASHAGQPLSCWDKRCGGGWPGSQGSEGKLKVKQ